MSDQNNSNQSLTRADSPQHYLIVKPDSNGVAKVTSRTALEVFQSPNPHFGKLAKLENAALALSEIESECLLQMRLIWPAEKGEVVAVLAAGFANHIFTTKEDWKVNDVSLFFQYLLTNQKPELKQYRKPDLTYIILFIGIYEDYKAEERERLHYASKENKSDVVTAYHPEVAKKILEVLDKNKPVKEEKPVNKVKLTMDELCKRWVKEYDWLKRRYPLYGDPDAPPINFVRIGKKKMDLQEFLEFKNKRYIEHGKK